MNIGIIENSSILLKPSKNLNDYIRTIKVSSDIPEGIANVLSKKRVKPGETPKPSEYLYLTTFQDRQFVNDLDLDSKITFGKLPLSDKTITLDTDNLLTVSDLHWLHKYLHKDNENKTKKKYLHELLEGSQIVLPKNSEIPRNIELEKRCERLRNAQANAAYNHMTKDVDCVRKRYPEDTLSFQIKQMNRHLIAIFQFIMSVLAGFAFGFTGVELLIGSLDFGFRLLLGIMCSLTIALAELYFLAKKLNEDLKFETITENKNKATKLD